MKLFFDKIFFDGTFLRRNFPSTKLFKLFKLFVNEKLIFDESLWEKVTTCKKKDFPRQSLFTCGRKQQAKPPFFATLTKSSDEVLEITLDAFLTGCGCPTE